MTPAAVAPSFPGDFYSPDSFTAPIQTEPQALPASWVSYQNFKPRTASGPQAELADFEAFRRTDGFVQVHQQIKDRLKDCLAFGRTHLTREECAKVEGHLSQFERHWHDSMTAPQGLFAPVDILNLYDRGKRDLDAACLKLADRSIDPRVRKRAFLLMTETMATCQGAGVAYERALSLLTQRDGGLRGTFYRQLQQITVAAIQTFVRRDMPEALRGGNEVHTVEWFRLALGIGGDIHDRRAMGRELASVSQLEACRRHLRQEVPPLKVVQYMAEAYLSDLREVVLAALGRMPEVFDTADAVQWQCLRRALEDLAADYGVIKEPSVLQLDPDTGECRIRTDPTLVARDLLVSLIPLGLVKVPGNRVAVQEERDGCLWQLLHVGEQLFFEVQKAPNGPLEIDSVTLAAVHKIQRAALRASGVTAVLGAQSPAALMALPPSDLTTLEQASLLMRRLGPERSATWVEGQAVNNNTLSLLLVAATEGGHPRLLNRLLRLEAWSANAKLALVGGRSIVEKALAHGVEDSIRGWLDVVSRAAQEWPQRQFEAFFMPDGGCPLLARALALGRADAADRLLGVLFEARRQQRLDENGLVRLLTLPAMQAGAGYFSVPIRSLGTLLAQAAARKDVGTETVQRVLEWERPDEVWKRIFEKNDVQVLHWYHDLVVQCAPYLRQHQVEAMLTSPVYASRNAQFEALLLAPEALRIRVTMLVEDALAKRMSPAAIRGMLSDHSARDVDWRWSYWFREDGRYASMLMDGVLELLRHQRLSRKDVQEWLAPKKKWAEDKRAKSALVYLADTSLLLSDRDGRPWLPPESRLKHWLAAVIRAKEAGAVDADEMCGLLSGGLAAGPPLFRAMCTANSYLGPRALIGAMLELRSKQLIDADALERLLKGKHRKSGEYALTQACARGQEAHVRIFIVAVAEAAAAGLLPREALVRLVNGRGRAGLGTGCFRAAFDSGNASMAKTLFNCTLPLLRDGPITPDEWVGMIAEGYSGIAMSRTRLPRGSVAAAHLEAAVQAGLAMRRLQPQHVARLQSCIEPPA